MQSASTGPAYAENKQDQSRQQAIRSTHRTGKRIHLRRNPMICVRCWRVWDEEEDSVIKRLFNSNRGQSSNTPVQHKACKGTIKFYYDLSSEEISQFAKEKLFQEVEYRGFFPVMSDLTRDDAPDTSHHNIP
jgi:hypothetical protein